VSLALLLLVVAGACPARAPSPDKPGLTAVAKLPIEEAMRENARGKKLYRQERWAEARRSYRAALTADPDFLDAQLNLACSFSREGRYKEAVDEAIKLVRAAYVPWQREVREAADLGILQDQKDYARLTGAMSDAAAAWGEAVGKSIFFVARTRPPVNVAGQGVLVLRLHQEIFAWDPETGRYFQVTAEDGRVLGFLRSPDGRRVAYLLGGKLVREEQRPEVLRGLSLGVIELTTMSGGASVPIPADAAKIELRFATTPEIVATQPDGRATILRLGEGGWEQVSTLGTPANLDSVVLTATGVRPHKIRIRRTGCPMTIVSRPDQRGLWRMEVRGAAGKPVTLDARYGAGVPGLPFPDGLPPAHADKKARKPAQNDKK
jgi:hypothetical protein